MPRPVLKADGDLGPPPVPRDDPLTSLSVSRIMSPSTTAQFEMTVYVTGLFWKVMPEMRPLRIWLPSKMPWMPSWDLARGSFISMRLGERMILSDIQ